MSGPAERCRAALDAVVPRDPAWEEINTALRVVLDGIEATLAEHVRTEGQGYRASGGYGDINPACRECAVFDEYAVPWPCAAHTRATASLAAIAQALGVTP